MPRPPGMKLEPNNRISAGTSSQNEILFIRGKAMSGAPIMIGTNQLPKPPIIAGMTMKNTMIRPCAVIRTFHRCLAWVSVPSSPRNCAQPTRCWMPGWLSSTRISPEIAPPTTPANIAKIR